MNSRKSESLIPRIRMIQENMTLTEKKIVEWVLNPKNLTNKTALHTVAQSLSVSEALVVKVAKLLGFSGFRDLRANLSLYFHDKNAINIELSENNTVHELVHKVFDISLQTIKEGKSIVDSKVIEDAAKCFFYAKNRDLYAAGGSSSVTDDIAHKFLRLGIRCNTYRDIHLMMMSASMLSEEDVVVVVSHSGKTSDLLEAVSVARKNGTKIICITHSYTSPIADLSDFIICTPAPDTPLLGKNASARILQLILVDAFFVSVALQNMEFSEINLEKTSHITDYFRQK
ncbi:transcriptional repressor AlsR [Chelonobacter oris]|nr:MurR/RpiR family transcriptional regulator [Chelonobacter oris]